MEKKFTLILMLVVASFTATAQTIQWQKLLGGINDDQFLNFKTQQTTDGGYIIAGHTNSSNTGTLTGLINNGGIDGWVIKLDASGNVTWQKLLGGTGEDQLFSIQQTTDGGYIVAGYSNSSNDGTLTGITNNGNFDGWILKLDASGNTTWQKLLGGSNGDYMYNMKQTTDGGYIIAGQSNSSNSGTLTGFTNNGGPFDGWVIKLDASGNTTWQKLLGGDNVDGLREVMQTAPDGGYIIDGYSNSTSNTGTLTGLTNNGLEDGWIVKLDVFGNTTWQKLLGGNNTDFLTPIKQTTDGGYITALASKSSNTGTLTGITNNGSNTFDGWVIKLDGSGNTTWQKLLGGTADDFLYGCRQTSDGGYILAGYSNSSNSGTLAGITNNGVNDGWVVKLTAAGNTQSQQLLGGDGDDRFFTVEQTTDQGYILEGYAGSNSGTGTFTGITNNGIFDGWVVKLTQFTLPVTLGDFTAKTINETEVKLDWFTLTESNNTGFYIERSLENTNLFYDLIFVPTKALWGNSSSKLDYTFIDVNQNISTAYYRLRQVDLDGHRSYSKIVSIKTDRSGRVTIGPNPSIDFVHIQSLAVINHIQCFNTKGQMVMNVSPKLTSCQLAIDHLPSGTYSLRIETSVGIINKLIVKQ